MSYEGYSEFLCENGHRNNRDCHEDDPEKCSFCGAPMAWWHSVDQTNGIIEDDPGTYPAPTEELGFDDKWQTDHHGNRYAIPIGRYRPLDGWTKLSPTT